MAVKHTKSRDRSPIPHGFSIKEIESIESSTYATSQFLKDRYEEGGWVALMDAKLPRDRTGYIVIKNPDFSNWLSWKIRKDLK